MDKLGEPAGAKRNAAAEQDYLAIIQPLLTSSRQVKRSVEQESSIAHGIVEVLWPQVARILIA
jgi:hypothetical protein